MSDFLTCIDNSLSETIKHDERKEINEPKTGQKIVLSTHGRYLIYTLDKDYFKAFPYFKEVEHLNSVCDYIIFTEKNEIPYIILIELKGKNSPLKQLTAGEHFCDFIMKRINVAHKRNFKPIVRKVGVMKKARGSTNIGDVKYNENGEVLVPYQCLQLDAFVK